MEAHSVEQGLRNAVSESRRVWNADQQQRRHLLDEAKQYTVGAEGQLLTQQQRLRIHEEKLHDMLARFTAYEGKLDRLRSAGDCNALAVAISTDDPERQRLRSYKERWNHVKSIEGGLRLRDVPWPFFSVVDGSTTSITKADLEAFLFHPVRETLTKSRREMIRTEILRWHPDKFHPQILSKVIAEDCGTVQLIAGEVARFLMELNYELENWDMQ